MSDQKCPFAGHTPASPVAAPRKNANWWPEQIDLKVLHQHSSLSDPMGEGSGMVRARARSASRR